MTDKEIIRTSKFLSLILRHEPERVGLKLGDAGWVGVDELLQAVNRHGLALSLDQLQHIVATSDKKRFAFSDDGRRSRASQGHSVEVDLQYAPQTLPEHLGRRKPVQHGGYGDGLRCGGLRHSGSNGKRIRIDRCPRIVCLPEGRA